MRPPSKKTYRKRKSGLKKKRVVRRRRMPLEVASCKELYSITAMTSNTPYNDLEQNLGFYKRASAIAENYQEFRIKSIKYRFIARYNTFQASTNETTVFPIPLMYTRLDKAGALPTGTSIEDLKAMGCRPKRFTKNINVSWAPGVQLATSNADATIILATKPLISPWLMTNKTVGTPGFLVNDTDHYGLHWFMETAGLPGDGTYEYDAEVEVVFEFRKPLAAIPGSGLQSVNVHTLRKGINTSTGKIVPA